MTQPWAPERRAETKANIDAAANDVAALLGADAVVVIAFYREGDDKLHIQDGGQCPMLLSDLYKGLAMAHETVAAGGEGFVQ